MGWLPSMAFFVELVNTRRGDLRLYVSPKESYKGPGSSPGEGPQKCPGSRAPKR